MASSKAAHVFAGGVNLGPAPTTPELQERRMGRHADNEQLRQLIIAMRMRECLSPNVIASQLALPASMVRNVLVQEGIQ
jgi:hypothetical protein